MLGRSSLLGAGTARHHRSGPAPTSSPLVKSRKSRAGLPQKPQALVAPAKPAVGTFEQALAPTRLVADASLRLSEPPELLKALFGAAVEQLDYVGYAPSVNPREATRVSLSTVTSTHESSHAHGAPDQSPTTQLAGAQNSQDMQHQAPHTLRGSKVKKHAEQQQAAAPSAMQESTTAGHADGMPSMLHLAEQLDQMAGAALQLHRKRSHLLQPQRPQQQALPGADDGPSTSGRSQVVADMRSSQRQHSVSRRRSTASDPDTTPSTNRRTVSMAHGIPAVPNKGKKVLSKHEEVMLTRVVHDYLGIQDARNRLSKVLQRQPTVNELAAAMGTRVEPLQHRIQTGILAKRQLIEFNMGLIMSVVFQTQKGARKRGLSVKVEDMMQEGIQGFLHAVTKFNPDSGYKLSTYSIWWIRVAVHRYVRRESGILRIPAHLEEKVARVTSARTRLSSSLGRPPTKYEIMAELGWDEQHMDKVLSAMQLCIATRQDLVSLEASVDQAGGRGSNGGQSPSFSESLVAGNPTFETSVGNAGLTGADASIGNIEQGLIALLDTLRDCQAMPEDMDPRGPYVLRMRMGMDVDVASLLAQAQLSLQATPEGEQLVSSRRQRRKQCAKELSEEERAAQAATRQQVVAMLQGGKSRGAACAKRKLTLEQIATVFGLSKERVRQIELKWLRYLHREHGAELQALAHEGAASVTARTAGGYSKKSRG